MKTWETVLRALVREVTVYSTPHLCPILSIRMLSACFLSLFPVLQYLSLVPIPCVAVLVLGSPETLSLPFPPLSQRVTQLFILQTKTSLGQIFPGSCHSHDLLFNFLCSTLLWYYTFLSVCVLLIFFWISNVPLINKCWTNFTHGFEMTQTKIIQDFPFLLTFLPLSASSITLLSNYLTLSFMIQLYIPLQTEQEHNGHKQFSEPQTTRTHDVYEITDLALIWDLASFIFIAKIKLAEQRNLGVKEFIISQNSWLLFQASWTPESQLQCIQSLVQGAMTVCVLTCLYSALISSLLAQDPCLENGAPTVC